MYSKGIVYKIVCNLNDVVYIGSTFNELRHRWSNHKAQFKSWLEGKGGCVSIFPYFKEHGIENFTIIKIKEYTVCRENSKDRRHISVYEQLWINKTRCINKINASIFLSQLQYSKLYKKEYRDKNKETISAKKKENYIKNKETISEYNKEYYNANKEYYLIRGKEYRDTNIYKIRARHNVKHKCECGSNYNQGNKKRHFKTQKHKKYVASLC